MMDRTTNRTLSRIGFALGLAFAASLAVGCGDDDEGQCDGGSFAGATLEGSYCTNIEIRWTELRIKLQTSGNRQFFSVEYVRPVEGGAIEKALVILFDITDVPVQAGQPIRFVDFAGSVRRVTSMIQNLTGELERDRTTLTFDEYTGTIGSQVRGEFQMLFMNGRALRGTFEGPLADAASFVD